MKHSENVPADYKTLGDITAKKLAVVNLAVRTTTPALGEFSLMLEEAKSLEDRGEYSAAAEVLDSRWKNLSETVDLSGLSKSDSASLLLRSGSVMSAIGTTDQIENAQSIARDFLWQSERFHSDLEDAEGKAQCLNKIGVTYWRNGDSNIALDFFKDSLDAAQTEESKAIALLNVAMAEFNLGNSSMAMEYSQRAYRYIGKVSPLTEAKIRNRIANSLEAKGVTAGGEQQSLYSDLAILEYEGAIVCYQVSGHEKLEVNTRNNIGFLYYSIGKYQEAIEVLEYAKTRAYQLKDKIHISLVCDTLARVYIALKDYRSALSNSSIAVKYLEANENSNRLSNYLCVHGVALARGGRVQESKAAFARAEEVGSFIGDRKLITQARMFALREFFSEYKEEERVSIFDDARRRLQGSQEKDIVDLIEEITAKIEGREIALESPVSESLAPVDIDAEILAFQRQFFERAIEATDGNQSKAAELVGLSRQLFKNRVANHYPDLLPKLKKNSGNKKKKVSVFPSHLIYSSQELKQHKIAISVLQSDMPPRVAGDVLLISLGKWHENSLIAFRAIFSESLKLAYLHRDGEQFTATAISGESFSLTGADFENIIGEVVGYCRFAEYQKYLKQRVKNAAVGLPYVLI